MEKIVLGLFAHPDDAEIVCAGTLSLFKKLGWSVHIATMTPGDKGSATLTKEDIAKTRKEEATNSAKLLDATYHCLECDDVYIIYGRETINKATALLRNVRPTIVFTSSPSDYMIDHEMTSLIAQTACFSAGIKNMDVAEDIFGFIPYLYYSDPLEGKDKFGNPIEATNYVDITSVMQIKEDMLISHASQRNWLLMHHKMDEYILSMKRFGEQRGGEINTKYAEGFRQHLGHSYPQNNILKEILGDLVISINK
jgi:LmbE family N-acetylglucosaminyl deacetylase